MRKIDDPQHAKRHRRPDGDDGVDAAKQQPVRERLWEKRQQIHQAAAPPRQCCSLSPPTTPSLATDCLISPVLKPAVLQTCLGRPESAGSLRRLGFRERKLMDRPLMHITWTSPRMLCIPVALV